MVRVLLLPVLLPVLLLQLLVVLLLLVLVVLLVLLLLLLLLLLHLAGQRLPSCAACFMCARHYVYEKCRGVRGRE